MQFPRFNKYRDSERSLFNLYANVDFIQCFHKYKFAFVLIASTFLFSCDNTIQSEQSNIDMKASIGDQGVASNVKPNDTPALPANVVQNDLVDSAAQAINVRIAILHNYFEKGCPNNVQSCAKGMLSLKFPPVMPAQWRILFSNLSPIIQANSQSFSLTHLNGDLHEIRPKQSIYKDSQEYTIEFYVTTPLVSNSVMFPNYLLVNNQGYSRVITSTEEVLVGGEQLKRAQHVIPFTTRQQLLRSDVDKVNIANYQERFLRYQSRLNAGHTPLSGKTTNRIIPRLASSSWGQDRVVLNNGIVLPDLGLFKEAQGEQVKQAITQRLAKVGLKVNVAKGLPIVAVKLKDKNKANEEYELTINSQNITVKYSDNAGLFYALMSIAQLYDNTSNTLPIGQAQDQPNFAFRGLHLDVSRNFRDKDFIIQILNQMAYYKLNKLHLHLADDEGWRLEIPTLPELTEVGSKRCFDESELSCLLPQLAGGDGQLKSAQQNSGYYSVEDYMEILQHAKARQIAIIPSLDMPGHSRAAIVAMNARHAKYMAQGEPEKAVRYYLKEEQDTSEYRSIQHYNDNTLNPCLDSTYRFVEEVLGQLINIHKNAQVPLQYYHIGADETAGAWTQSPACRSLIKSNPELEEVTQLGPYFIEKVTNKVSELGVTPAAWSDGLLHSNASKLPHTIQSNAWETLYSGGHNKAHTMLNNNWELVLSTPDVLYFDFPYEADPIEPGYYWGSRFTDSYQVFQFMPENLPVHAEIWTDNFGQVYEALPQVNLNDGKRIKGIQAQLWSETVRSNTHANYMLFPRLLITAERAWHKPKWALEYAKGIAYSTTSNQFSSASKQAMNLDWQQISLVLTTKAMPQLVNEGVVPRVPLPGAKIEAGMLVMISPIQGLILEYKTKQSDWQVYTKPVDLGIDALVSIRSRIVNTDISSRIQNIAAKNTRGDKL